MTAGTLSHFYLHPVNAISTSRMRWAISLCLFVAFGIALPQLCHAFGLAGKVFLPIHFMVFLAGSVLGWRAGFLAGLAVPLVSFGLFGFPPLLLPIALESMAYGSIAGFLMHEKKLAPLSSLIIAIIAGRLVHLALMLMLGAATSGDQVRVLLLVSAPGTFLQLLLIPPLARFATAFLGLSGSKEETCPHV